MEEGDSINFLNEIIDLIKEDAIFQEKNCFTKKVIEFHHPNDLKKKINFSLKEKVGNSKDLLELCRLVIKYSVKTSHPHFYNQLYGGVDLYGLAGSWITEAMNTNQHTYEIAPAFTLTEQEIIKHVQEKIGYTNGDGIFSPGGSISNMYGMVLARYWAFPEIKTKGLSGLPTLVAFTSKDAHYSIIKAAHWLGIGTDNLIKIETDDCGRMVVSELENQIKNCLREGKYPFFVNATAGTTVLGAIDPLFEIAEVCQTYSVWLHIDACFGGSLFLSKEHKNKLNGLEKSNSISWNPHKMLGAPLQCSIFLTKHNNIFHECNAASATYLFQQDKFYDVSYDTGDKSVQCGRKVDAFKLWVMWKARGDAGLEKLVDNAMECARYFKEQIEFREGFRLVIPSYETSTVCFWYVPFYLRNEVEDEEWRIELNKVAPKIKENLVMSGSLMIGYTPLGHKGHCNFFRMVTTCQPVPTFKDMDYVITQIELHGNELNGTPKKNYI